MNVGGEDDKDSDDDLQEKLDDGENPGDFGIETLIMFAFKIYFFCLSKK